MDYLSPFWRFISDHPQVGVTAPQPGSVEPVAGANSLPSWMSSSPDSAQFSGGRFSLPLPPTSGPGLYYLLREIQKRNDAVARPGPFTDPNQKLNNEYHENNDILNRLSLGKNI